MEEFAVFVAIVAVGFGLAGLGLWSVGAFRPVDLSRCSFCGAPRTHLVSGFMCPPAAACDACAARLRDPPTKPPILLRRLD